mmetsp:Transcript_88495/g.235487  ORF Transcript_88495/g.235487 Transcript_88495/m.235487 type:complete len:80 (+) Transcript_88495:751-990(+)
MRVERLARRALCGGLRECGGSGIVWRVEKLVLSAEMLVRRADGLWTERQRGGLIFVRRAEAILRRAEELARQIGTRIAG